MSYENRQRAVLLQVPTQHLGLRPEPLGKVVAAELLVHLRGNRALSYFILDDRP